MRQIWNIARKELKGFFDHPTAYILAVAFLTLSLYLTFRNIFLIGVADLRSFFNLLPWLFTVFVPAVTMRSLAEERGRGTLEWLVTQPLSEFQLAIGKFLGNWIFVLVTLVGTLPMAVGVLMFSDADAGIMVGQYLGASFFAAQLVGIGLLASAATKNQITAFIMAATLSFALILVGLPFVLTTMPQSLATVVGQLAVIPHFDAISRGVVDLRDLLYFVTTTGLLITLTYFLLLRERLSNTRGAYRRLRFGVIAATVGVILLNLLGGRIYGRIDLTGERLYTLSDGTRDLLRDLDDIITIKLFVSDELPPEIALTLRDVRDLVNDYRRISGGSIRLEELNPDDDPAIEEEATSYGIQSIRFNVTREDEFQVTNGWLGLAILYAETSEAIPFIDSSQDLEYRLTSTISSMITPLKPTVAFLTGFGAKSQFEVPAAPQLLGDRYDLVTVDIANDSIPPELHPLSQNVVVLAGPTQPLSPNAVSLLDEYLNAGGAALFFLDRVAVDQQSGFAMSTQTGLEDLLDSRGVQLAEGIVFDAQNNQQINMGQQSIFQVLSPYPLWPRAIPGGLHPSTRGLTELSLEWTNPLEIVDSTRATPLWTTTDFGGRFGPFMSINPRSLPTPTEDQLGREVVAAAILPDPDSPDADRTGGRVVVTGDSNFLEEGFLRANPQNLSFLANSVDWLAQDESLIDIRAKIRTPPPLVFESEGQRGLLRWGNLAGVPLAFVLFGVFRATRRRRQSEARWQEIQMVEAGQ